MPRSLLSAVVAGLAGAVMFVSAAVLPMVGLVTGHISPVPLMAVGLVFGPGASLVAGLVGAVALALMGTWQVALGYAMADILPSVVVVVLALRYRPVGLPNAPQGVAWYPTGGILVWLTGIGLGLLALAALVLDGGDGFEATVTRGLGQALDLLAADAPAGFRGRAAAIWAPILPGMVATGWLLRAVVSAVLALWLVARRGLSPRPVPAYTALDLPHGLVLVLAGLLAAGWLLPGDPGYAARNGAVLAVTPFVFRGIAAVHLAARQTKVATGLLTAFYVVFVLSSGLAVVAVAGLGLVDHFARRRPPDSGRDRQEEE